MKKQHNLAGAIAFLSILLALSYIPLGIAIEPQFRINSTTSNTQSVPAVATDGTQYFAVWQSNGQDGDDEGIFGKLISADGIDISGELLINDNITNNQLKPDIASNGSRFMIVWQSDTTDMNGSGIAGKIFDSTATAIVPELSINNIIAGNQISPKVIAVGSNFIIVWTDESTASSTIKLRHFDPDGLPLTNEIPINTKPNITDAHKPAITANTNQYAIAWTANKPILGDSIYVRLFNTGDTPVFPEEKRVNIAVGTNTDPSISTDGTGFLIVWTSTSADGSGTGILGRFIDNDGNMPVSTLAINSFTNGNQQKPNVSFNGSEYLVTWVSEEQDGYDNGIFGQLISTDGSFIGSPFRVNTHPEGSQDNPACSSIGTDFFVFWDGASKANDTHGIYGTHLITPNADSDSDTLVNYLEWANFTDPFNPDTDSDMLSDGQEVLSYGTDPLDNDSDNDTLIDGEEIFIIPTESIVNEYTSNGQTNVALSRSAHGYFLVWESTTPEDNPTGIFGRLLDNDAIAISNDIHINTFTPNKQLSPAVASNGSTYCVVWESVQQDTGDSFFDAGIYGRIIDIDGTPISTEIPINTTKLNDQRNPAVASDGTNYLITWQSFGQNGNSDYDIYARIMDNTGTFITAEQQINTFTTLPQENPKVIYNGTRYLIVWESFGQDSDKRGIYGQLLDNDGSKIGSEFRVNTHFIDNQVAPAIATDGSFFLVVWASFSEEPDNDNFGIFAQMIDSNGDKIGNELSINTFTTGSQTAPDVTYNGQEYFVVWHSFNQEDNDGNFGVYGQRIATDGTFIGQEESINTFKSGTQNFAAITAQGRDYLIAFQGPDSSLSTDIFATRITWASGTDPLNPDTDADNASDADEITAGTNPLNANSLFDIFSLDVLPQTVYVTFSWSSIPGKRYTIWADSSNDSDGFVILEDNFLSQGLITTYTDLGGGPAILPHPSAESKSRLYKVAIKQ